jgi:hypothetical protein
MDEMETNPQRWHDMSFDMKCMFIFHGSMMVLMLLGAAAGVPLWLPICLTVMLFLSLTLLSLLNRRRSGWIRPGMPPEAMVRLRGTVLVGFVIAGVLTAGLWPVSSATFPWLSALFGIVVWNSLSQVGWVVASRARFESQCQRLEIMECQPTAASENQQAADRPVPIWKQALAALALLYVLWVFFGFLVYFSFSVWVFRHGEESPTPTHKEPYVEHGQTVYITPVQERIICCLAPSGYVGIPSLVLLSLGMTGVEWLRKKAGTRENNPKEGDGPSSPFT